MKREIHKITLERDLCRSRIYLLANLILAQTNKCSVMGVLLLGMSACFCEAQEASQEDQVLGELRLEGKHIERLVLRRNDGHTERLDKPPELVRLPVGQYHVLESHLSGGYACFQGPGPNAQRVVVAEKEPAFLKVGAPLKPTLSVERRGRVLALDYKLLGVGGEAYASKDRSRPPSFTIYKGDKDIASGTFKFG